MDDMGGEIVMMDGKPKELHTELEVIVGDGLEVVQGKLKFQNSAKAVMNSVKVSQAVRNMTDNNGKPLILTSGDQQIIGNNKLLTHNPHEDDVISNKSNNSFKKPSNDVSRSSLLFECDEKRDPNKDDAIGGTGDLDGIGDNNAADEMDADKVETATADVIVNEYPVDCFPDKWYEKCPGCLEETPWLLRWKELRFNSYNLVENKYFETLCITLILISSMTLVRMHLQAAAASGTLTHMCSHRASRLGS